MIMVFSLENIYLLCGILVSLVGLIFSVIDLVKNKRYVRLGEIVNTIPTLIRYAENYITSTDSNVKLGPVRLSYVLSELHQMCIDENVKYDEQYFVSVIEDVLSSPQKKIENKEVKNEVQNKIKIG